MLYQETLNEPDPETMEDTPFVSAVTADTEERESLPGGLPTQEKAVVADESRNDEEAKETEAIE